MPLRDHFRPPLDDEFSWEEVHGGWPMVIVTALNGLLPSEYRASPRVHIGQPVEIDVATFNRGAGHRPQDDGGVATAVWSPVKPSQVFDAEWPDADEYEVLVHNTADGARRLVAAVELVSPANKDRPEARRAFVAKCAALLQNRVSVVIVDLVTTRHFNLYQELLAWAGRPADAEATTVYATACRVVDRRRRYKLETWDHPLQVGQPLPTVPLWISPDLAVPLDLETTYETTCRALRIV